MNFKNSPETAIFLIPLLILVLSFNLCTGQSYLKQSYTDSYSPSTYKYPLKLLKEGVRYVVDQNNRPFFWSGDAAWSLIAQLNKEDADYYFGNRMKKGFSLVMVNLIEHKFSTNAPANFYGEMPFNGKPFITPNEKYFEHADYVIRSAAQRNIVVLLAPVYLGYDCKDEGWCEEVETASEQDMHFWGKFLGNRYKSYDNIIWLIAGDTDPSQVKSKILLIVKGIRESDTIHLISAHNQPESMAVTPWAGETWLSVNNVYSYDSLVYKHFKEAYDHVPVLPYFQIESAYENEHKSTPQQLRSQAYWAILSGAMGHLFGNCPVWHFGSAGSWCNLTDWKSQLENQGSESMDYLQRLFRSRPWQILIPDFDHQIITSGFGKWGLKNYVTAAFTSDRNTMIAYLPLKSTVTVDMGKVNGRFANCWWFNPSNGKSDFIGAFKNSGQRRFTPNFEGDWVLIIDNVSANLPVPGTKIYLK